MNNKLKNLEKNNHFKKEPVYYYVDAFKVFENCYYFDKFNKFQKFTNNNKIIIKFLLLIS